MTYASIKYCSSPARNGSCSLGDSSGRPPTAELGLNQLVGTSMAADMCKKCLGMVAHEGVLWLKGRMKGCPRAIPEFDSHRATSIP